MKKLPALKAMSRPPCLGYLQKLAQLERVCVGLGGKQQWALFTERGWQMVPLKSLHQAEEPNQDCPVPFCLPVLQAWGFWSLRGGKKLVAPHMGSRVLVPSSVS